MEEGERVPRAASGCAARATEIRGEQPPTVGKTVHHGFSAGQLGRLSGARRRSSHPGTD